MWMTTLVAVFGAFVGIWAIIRYVIIIEIRVDNNIFRTLYQLLGDVRKFVVEEEFFTEARHPVVYRSFCMFNEVPIFYLTHQERMLQAGFQGKDFTTTIICLRWHHKKIKSFLSFKLKQMQLDIFGIPVLVATPWNTDKIGSIKHADNPIIDKSIFEDIDNDVSKVMSGEINKTGAILHGSPGNGKTSFIKYIAVKYNLPIVIITFVPEFTNIDIMFMFSNIPDNCIVLLEDFDNYFNERKCIIGESSGGGNNMGIKFTFDSILNCLDGVYNSYNKVVFFMTANDIGKIDSALKQRPSRFKFVRNFDSPSISVRKSIVGEWAESLGGLNLDQVLRMAEFKSLGDTIDLAQSKLNITTLVDK